MIDAGLNALAERIPASHHPDLAMMPALAKAPAVAQAVAEAVAITAVCAGQASRAHTVDEALSGLDRARWQPIYGAVKPYP